MNPLEQLNDINLGEPIGIWPLAWGWWILITLCLFFLIGAFLVWHKNRLFNAARRDAIQELKIIEDAGLNALEKNAAINKVLKRCTQHYFKNVSVSSLHGEKWADWLGQQLPKKHQGKFTSDMLEITTTLYTAEQSKSVTPFIDVATFWLSNARFKTPPMLKSSSRGAHV